MVIDQLIQMRKMLALAKDNIRQAMDKAKSYVDANRSFKEFEEGEIFFLKVPSHSKSLILGEYEIFTSILWAMVNFEKNRQSCL